MNYIKRYGIWAVAMVLQGCIGEDLSMCNPELLLKCSYTLNPQNSNLFDSNVHKLTLFVFDKDSLFYNSCLLEGNQLENDRYIRLPLPAGHYQVVAWGGEMSTYRSGEMTDPQSNILNTELRKGTTRLHDFKLLIDYTESSNGALNILDKPDDLFHGIVYNAVSQVNATTGPTVSLTKDSNVLKVKITGLGNLNHSPVTSQIEAPKAAPMEVQVSAQNGRYKHDNSIGEYARTINYLQNAAKFSADTMQVELTVLRLIIGRSPMLIVTDPQNPGKPLYKQNIVAAILQNPDFVTQEDIDREDEFEFLIELNKDLSITVKVNGWTIQEIYPEI